MTSAWLKKVGTYLTANRLCEPHARILLAVSGGVDSMVLAETMLALGNEVGVAHCHFGLRGQEADEDTAFVKQYFESKNIPIAIAYFDTKTFAKQNHYSTQEAARILRYNFLEKTRLSGSYDTIAVAHHRSDDAETNLYGLLRNKNFELMPRLMPRNGKVIRPLLFASKADIMAEAQASAIPFREDRSNFSDDYTRNYIRIHLAEHLAHLNPRWEQQLTEKARRHHDQLALLRPIFQAETEKRVTFINDEIDIHIEGLEADAFTREWVHYVTDEMLGRAYSYAERIYSLIFSAVGKEIIFPDGTLTRERGYLHFQPKKEVQAEPSRLLILSSEKQKWNDVEYYFTDELPDDLDPQFLIEKIDIDHINQPITIRFWEAGDVMLPLGMKGLKKIKAVLNEMKVPSHRKRGAFVLTDARNQVLYVEGYRISEAVKCVPSTTKIHYWIWKRDGK
jgi:tRNA(Ile)-lysidine synthase